MVFLIFDGKTKKYMEEEGLDHGTVTTFLPSTRLVDFDATVK